MKRVKQTDICKKWLSSVTHMWKGGYNVSKRRTDAKKIAGGGDFFVTDTQTPCWSSWYLDHNYTIIPSYHYSSSWSSPQRGREKNTGLKYIFPASLLSIVCMPWVSRSKSRCVHHHYLVRFHHHHHHHHCHGPRHHQVQKVNLRLDLYFQQNQSSYLTKIKVSLKSPQKRGNCQYTR